MITILDCTLRDGGYYNNWNYPLRVTKEYFRLMDHLPVAIVELGYRSLRSDEYLGELFYTPDYILQIAAELMPSKQIAVMLDEKDSKLEDLDRLLDPCVGRVHLIRIAASPETIDRAMLLARAISKKGFRVALNVMYASKWMHDESAIKKIAASVDGLDYFYVVDSYGSLFPQDVTKLVTTLRSHTAVPLGFHGHNNLELALANSLAAIAAGCDVVDSTILGMGRGAGNLKTELALITLRDQLSPLLDYESLSSITGIFTELQQEFGWGTNLAYMISGAYSIPQKEVMEKMNKRRYDIGNIVQGWGRYVHNKNQLSRQGFLPLRAPARLTRVIITGGGASVLEQSHALLQWLQAANVDEQTISLVHSSSRFVSTFASLNHIQQYFCLVGKEGKRLETLYNISALPTQTLFVVPSDEKDDSTYVPTAARASTVQASPIEFISGMDDSPLALAIQTANDLGARDIYLFGFDGYLVHQDQSALDLFNENQHIIDRAAVAGIELISLTQTRYQHIRQVSIFQLITSSSL